jgi:hypothetical protein
MIIPTTDPTNPPGVTVEADSGTHQHADAYRFIVDDSHCLSVYRSLTLTADRVIAVYAPGRWIAAYLTTATS